MTKRVCPDCKQILEDRQRKHCPSPTCTWIKHKCGAVVDWRTEKYIPANRS